MWMDQFVVMKLEVPGPHAPSHYATAKIKKTQHFLRFKSSAIYIRCLRAVSPWHFRDVTLVITRNILSSSCDIITVKRIDHIYWTVPNLPWPLFAICDLKQTPSLNKRRESWSTYAIVIHMTIQGITWLCPQYKNRESLFMMLLFMSKK